MIPVIKKDGLFACPAVTDVGDDMVLHFSCCRDEHRGMGPDLDWQFLRSESLSLIARNLLTYLGLDRSEIEEPFL